MNYFFKSLLNSSRRIIGFSLLFFGLATLFSALLLPYHSQTTKIAAATLSLSESDSVTAAKANIAESYGKLPMLFEANGGQTDEQVKFIARGRGYTLFLTPEESVFVLSHKNAATTLRMHLAGANKQAQLTAEEEAPTKVNYFTGNDPSKWRTNLATSKRIRCSEVYPGIDLVYYGNQRQLEYDLVVAPGADLRQISLDFAGADKVEIEESSGDLLLHTALGILRQHQPDIYQNVNGARKKMDGRYVKLADNRIGFEVANYDTSKTLLIDPVLVYSTYLGGSPRSDGGVNGDTLDGITVDSSGNAYIVGTTESADFPITPGAFKTNFGNVNALGYVTKLNASGTALVYSSYLNASPTSIAVDSLGNAYLTGIAGSTFPATAGAYQTTMKGNFGNAFVLKLNPAGSGLVFATFFGGTGNPGSMSMIAGGDYGKSIAIDTAGNSYIAGSTFSHDFPVTTGAVQTTNHSTNAVSQRTGFVTKVNATGTDLVYSTYLGGTGSDQASGIAVDSAGNAYVTGTASRDFPTTTGAFMTTYPERSSAFITKFNPAGIALVYSTYLGGSAFGGTDGEAIALDASGNAYITGTTESTNYPTTIGSFNRFGCGGVDKGFVTKLNATGSDLVYSTYLCAVGASSSGNSTGVFGIGVDASGNAIVTGYTTGDTFPVTADAYQNQLDGGESPFLTKFNAAGSALTYSTFFGGQDFDISLAIALDSSGNAYIAGETRSTNFPTTPGAFQTTYAGGDDAFVAKFSFAAATSGQLLNISTRAHVVSGDEIAIGGFIITGNQSRRVIIRGIGPSLPDYVPNKLGDPVLNLFDSNSSVTPIATNNDWKSNQQTEIENTGLAPGNDLDAAIVTELAPGAYTAQLSGNANSTGIGLVEIYDLGAVVATAQTNGTTSSQVSNISTRGMVETGDNVMIGGVIVDRGETTPVVVDARGPSLPSSINNRLADPTLSLYDSNGIAIATNDDWQQDPAHTFIPSNLSSGYDSKDSAVYRVLTPGNYTTVVRGKNETSGVALVEIYHVE